MMMLEPCAVKVASTVLRRVSHREMGLLTDKNVLEKDSQKTAKKLWKMGVSEFANCGHKFLRNLYTHLTPRFM